MRRPHKADSGYLRNVQRKRTGRRQCRVREKCAYMQLMSELKAKGKGIVVIQVCIIRHDVKHSINVWLSPGSA